MLTDNKITIGQLDAVTRSELKQNGRGLFICPAYDNNSGVAVELTNIMRGSFGIMGIPIESVAVGGMRDIYVFVDLPTAAIKALDSKECD